MKIVKSGILASIQSKPNFGHQWVGISPSGAADLFSFKILNLILGNRPDEPCIEFHFPAIMVQFEEDCTFGISGADFSPILDTKPLRNLEIIFAKKGQVLSFKQRKSGFRAYFSVKGGFESNLSDIIPGKIISPGINISLKSKTFHFNKIGLNNRYFEDKSNSKTIRFIPGNEYFELDDSSCQIINNESFEMNKNSNRMGIRLMGSKLKLQKYKEIISNPVSKGTIQLLPDGGLVVLMSDGQVTGGYPRLGFVSSIDIDVLTQKSPGEQVFFKAITLEESRQLILDRNIFFKKLGAAINLKIKTNA